MPAPTPKSLILDLLSTMPPEHPVPVGGLVRAAGLFGIGDNSVRVALVRLRTSGLVESNERGLYRLGAAATQVNRHVRSWRAVEAGVRRWDGSWVGLAVGSPAPKDRRRARSLRLLGFRPLVGTLQVRPDNLVGGVEAVRQRLESLGIESDGSVFRLSELDSETDRRARTLWDVRSLELGYAATRAELEASAARLPTLSREAAMAESFQLGGAAIRQIVYDPLLPAPIVSVADRRALVDTMRRYDTLGRRFWKNWAGDSVELEQSPGDVRGLAGEGDALPAVRWAKVTSTGNDT